MKTNFGRTISVMALVCSMFTPLRSNSGELKIEVTNDAVYSVSVNQIAAAFGDSTSNISSVLSKTGMVLTCKGRQLPAEYSSNGIVFVGRRYSSLFTDKNVYFLSFGKGLGITTINGYSATTTTATFVDTVSSDVNNTLLTDFRYAPDYPWINIVLFPGSFGATTNTTVLLTRFASKYSYLDVSVQIPSGTPSAAKVIVNNLVTNVFNPVSGRTNLVVDLQGLPVVGSVTVKTVAVSGQIGLDKLSLSYSRFYGVTNGLLVFDSGSNPVVTLSGLSPSPRLFDITAETACSVSGNVYQVNGDWNLSFTPSASNSKYVVCSAPIVNTNLSYVDRGWLKSPTNEADWIAVYSEGFETQANMLASYRADKSGMKTMVVSFSSIVNDFNCGVYDARAINTFLLRACSTWKTGPKYLVLIGHGSLNYKKYKNDQGCMLPTWQVVDVDGFLRTTDYNLSDIDDDGISDVGIGRIPCFTTSEFSAWFAKLTNFESNASSARTNGVAVAGTTDPAGVFSIDSDEMLKHVPYSFDRLYMISNSASYIRSNLLDRINSGVKMVSYYGQGNINQIGTSSEMFLHSTNAPSLTNSTLPSAFFLYACQTTDHGGSNFRCLGEDLLFSTGGAAIVYGSSSIIYGSQSRVWSSHFSSNMFVNSLYRFGDTIVKAAHEEEFNSPAETGIWTYNILGDPATSMGNPSEPRTAPYYVDSRSIGYTNWIKIVAPPVIYDENINLLPANDYDVDGFSNLEEQMAGTDPFDSGDFLRMTAIESTGNTVVRIKWRSANHRMYSYDVSSNLVFGSFNPVLTNIPGSAPTNTLWQDSKSATNLFFRIKVY